MEALGGVLEGLEGVLEALGSVLEALEGVLEAHGGRLGGQDDSRWLKNPKSLKTH